MQILLSVYGSAYLWISHRFDRPRLKGNVSFPRWLTRGHEDRLCVSQIPLTGQSRCDFNPPIATEMPGILCLLLGLTDDFLVC